MKVIIYKIKETLDAVAALELIKEFVVLDKDIDPLDIELSEWINVIIYCHGITVNDDRISIEFPDGRIGDYKINNDEYCHIKIL